MGTEHKFVRSLHNSTHRDYLHRMMDDKVTCMTVSQKFEEDYWDGDRRFGYGGYKYIPGRWKCVAETLIEYYELTNESKVLDIGCGKGYLLHEMKLLLPGINVVGLDISKYGISCATELIKDHIILHDCRKPLPFGDKSFDLLISLGTLHNFRLPELAITLSEIDRVAQKGYIMVESFRNNKELFNLQCWALTAKAFLEPDEWRWFFEQHSYFGDYEFIFFE